MKKHNIPTIVCSLLAVALIVFLVGTVVCEIGIPKYPQIESTWTFLFCILLLVLLPVVLVWGAVTGIRKGLTWCSIMILACSIFYIPLWFFAYMGTSTITSATTDVEDYRNFDTFVDTYMQNNDGYDLLDVNLDCGTITNYYYRYIPMDRSFVVFADVSFADIGAYVKEQKRLDAFTQEINENCVELYSTYTHVGSIQVDPARQSVSYFITNDATQFRTEYSCKYENII